MWGEDLKKKTFLVLASFLFLWTILTILAVTWGTRFDWPDNVHIDYGFPLVWSTQTLSTLTGTVDLWTVNLTALTTNLVFWLATMLTITAILLYFFNKNNLTNKKSNPRKQDSKAPKT
ncbi:MAG: hypothetical protein CW691_06890 [Candidatus Bathyarchaeum sp.]|nr:MAG: hypothetical protein CW691_06890 [Candidatus Bathyarchaeum sp.]